jgi:tRNA 2-thiouridine synthesizing protein A
MSDPIPNKTLDCIGLYCPDTLFQTRISINEIKVGEVLEVLADDPAAEEDIKSFVKYTGYEILGFEKNDDLLRFLIKKTK